MNKNVGSADRILRVATGLVIIVLYFMGALSGTGALAFGVAAAALLLTSAMGSCPLYSILKISTRKKE